MTRRASTGSIRASSKIDDAEAHDAVLDESRRDRLADELGTAPYLTEKSKEEAFIATKRGGCGGIYAAASDLHDIVPALRRDNISFQVLPIWVTRDEILRAKQKLADKGPPGPPDRDNKDKRCLEAAKSGELEVERSKEEIKLREQNGSAAKAFEDLLNTEDKGLVEDPKGSRFATKYPSLAELYSKSISEDWEFVSLNAELRDYGTVQFKGRLLEAGLGVAKFTMRNRILGQYKELCFTTGFANDREFDIEREYFAQECSHAAEKLATYVHDEGFVSYWNVPRLSPQPPPPGCPLSSVDPERP
jgi:hypothetical protein